MDGERRLWERQPWDTKQSWQAFRIYLLQEQPRSLIKALREYQRSIGREPTRRNTIPGYWKTWSSERGELTWAQRAAAYDDYLAEQERAKWEQRRLALKEQEWEIGSRLLERGQQMLMFPLSVQKKEEVADEDGKQVHSVTIIMPAEWKLGDIPKVVQAGSKLARLSADEPTDIIDWHEEARKAGVDPDAFKESIREIIAQMGGALHPGGAGGDEPDDGDGEAVCGVSADVLE